MKKSINLYFNKTVNTKEKLNFIKQAGYDEFFTGCNNNEKMSLKEQIEYGKKIGLNCTMIHCYYNQQELNNFWLNNSIGDKVLNDYISQIEECKFLTDNFVVHLHSSKESVISEIGLNRIRQLLKICEKYDINLCIENLYSEIEIPYIFKNIQHKKYKICYDIGHQNFLTPNFNVFKDYGKFVTVLHLHDNDSITDMHQICGTVNIDFKKFAQEYKKQNLNLTLSNEISYKQDYKKVIIESLKSLQNLEKLINNF